MRVVAEGIETKEQVEFLRKCGCDALQGYFFAEPVTAEELLAKSGGERDAGPNERYDCGIREA